MIKINCTIAMNFQVPMPKTGCWLTLREAKQEKTTLNRRIMFVSDRPPPRFGSTPEQTPRFEYKLPQPVVVPAHMSLTIRGIGVAYPPHEVSGAEFERMVLRHFEASPAIQKTLHINKRTRIKQRPMLCTAEHPLLKDGFAPPINLISEHFRIHGVPLAARASLQALEDAELSPADITHVVCTTVTDSSNPGYDFDLVQHLGIQDNGVQRHLLAGVGCAGGLSALRTASSLALAAHACGRRAVVLVVATEVVSPFGLMELERVQETGLANVGVSLFSDCSSAVVLVAEPLITATPASSSSVYTGWGRIPRHIWSNLTILGTTSGAAPARPSPLPGLIDSKSGKGVYTVHAFTSWTFPDSSALLRYDVNPNGWNIVLSPEVPKLTASSLDALFRSLMSSAGLAHLGPADLDWAIHPGGAAILSACAKTMGLDEEDHLRGSWGVYTERGNSSSASVLSVLQALRGGDYAKQVIGQGASQMVQTGRRRQWVVAVAFGPGVLVEITLLKRVKPDVE